MRFSFALLASCSLLAVPAMAQTTDEAPPVAASANDDGGAADIVVTAQRRAERVQDVPIAIAVVSSEQLDRQQVTQLSDLTRTTASIQINSSGGGSGGGNAFIRGIGTAGLTRSAEGAVGIVVDGVVQGNTSISNLFDIARVEVLRGPQGTLFGQSVSAGVINISTIAPDPTKASGKIMTELMFDGVAGSEIGRQVIRAGVNVPVSEDSAVRFSMYGTNTTGILYNTYLDEKDKLREVGFRGRYRGEFGAVTVNLIGDYNYSSGRNGQFFTLTAVDNPVALTSLCGITPRPGNREHCSAGPERQSARSYGGSAQFDVELGSMTLTSITAHRQQDLYVTGDIDRLPDPLVRLNVRSGIATDYKQFTQELRLASDPTNPLSFVVGGFYQNADTGVSAGPQEGARTVIPTGAIVSTAEYNDTESETLSGFGEARYETGPFTVFAGARLTHSRVSHSGTRQQITPVQGTLLSADLGFKDTDISWRAGAQFKPSSALMLYGTVARGYKNAQIAPIRLVGTVPELGTIVLPEKPTAYEVGLKSTLFGGRMAFNIDGFYQEVRDFQAQTAFRDPITQLIQVAPINIRKVVSKGIEADAFGKIGRHLTLNASAIYNVAEYPDDYLARNGAPLGGEQIAFAPRFSANFSGEYTIPLSDDVEGFISANAQRRSKTRLSDERAEDFITVDRARWIFGGRIGARVSDQWTVAVFANNIGASRLGGAIAGLAAQPGSAYSFGTAYGLGSVRQVGIQGQLEF